MARPQVQEGPRFPEFIPAAGGGISAPQIQVIAPGSTIDPLIPLLNDGEGVVAQLLEQHRERAQDRARGQVAAGASEVVQKLISATGDPTKRAQILNEAVEQGVIPRAANPYFRIALLEAEGRGSAQRALSAIEGRLRAGEHLPREDATGAFSPGADPQAIYNEEVSKFRASAALNSQLGARQFAGELSRLGPGVLAQAQADIDAADLRRLETTVQGEISSLVMGSQDQSPEDFLFTAVSISEQADVLREAGLEDWREKAAQGVVRGALVMGEADPDRALLALNTRLSGIQIGNQTLDDNPRTALIVAEARHNLRRAAEDQADRQNREDERLLKAQTRAQTEFIGARLRELAGAALPEGEVRRRAIEDLHQKLEGVEENRELLRIRGLQEIDAALVTSATSDPTLVSSFQQRIALATSAEDLAPIEAQIRAVTGDGLFGGDVSDLMATLQAKEQDLSTGFASNPLYSQFAGQIASVRPPAGLPPEEAAELDAYITSQRAGFNTELVSTGAWKNGQLDGAAAQKLAGVKLAEMQRRTAEAELKLNQSRIEVTKAIQENASPDQIAREFGGRFGALELDEHMSQALSRGRLVDGAIVTDYVREPLAQAQGALLRALLPDGAENATPGQLARFELELNALEQDYDSRLLETLSGVPVDPMNVQRKLRAAGREFANERLKELGAEAQQQKDDPRAAFLPAQKEGDEPTDLVAGEMRARALDADFTAAVGVIAGAPLTADSAVYEPLRGFGAEIAPATLEQMSAFQGNAFAGGFFSRQTSFAQARDEANAAAAQAVRAGANPGSAWIQANAPLGIDLDTLLAGKAMGRAPSEAERFLLAPLDSERLKNISTPAEISFKLKDVPPFTTAVFESPAEVKRAWNTRGADIDKLFAAWGLETPAAQELWRDTQIKLAERIQTARARRGGK